MTHTDPLISLYSTIKYHYDRLILELGWEHETTPSFLHLKDNCFVGIDFVDPLSGFEADKAKLIDIEKLSPELYTLGLDLYIGNTSYEGKPNTAIEFAGKNITSLHAVVVPIDGPPALVHENDLSHNNEITSLLPQYIKSGNAEIISLGRAIHLHAALEKIKPEHIDPESAY